MSTLTANNVHVSGLADGPPVVFAHGFGCDQDMWRRMTPAFEETHKLVLFDHMGLGRSDVAAYDPELYATLDGYADDVTAICDELDLRDVTLVGHSVSAMIAVLAARRRPERIARLVMICPSPRYLNDPATGYEGGFDSSDIDDLLATLASNHLGWAASLAPLVMGNTGDPRHTAELETKFCQADPDILLQFARATFLGDNRADLPLVEQPCLLLQTREDVLAPPTVTEHVLTNLRHATLKTLDAVGHCPNLSAPETTAAAIKAWL